MERQNVIASFVVSILPNQPFQIAIILKRRAFSSAPSCIHDAINELPHFSFETAVGSPV